MADKSPHESASPTVPANEPFAADERARDDNEQEMASVTNGNAGGGNGTDDALAQQQHLVRPASAFGTNTNAAGGAKQDDSHLTGCARAGSLAKWAVFELIPLLTWIPQYKPKEYLGRDLIGGLVMGVMFVPMGLAYAALVGIPLHIGLYSSAVYTGVYGLLGSVASLSMGPVAEVSLLIIGDSSLPTEPNERAETVQAIAFQVGILSLVLCIFKGGVVIRNSFARAVGNAYATAAGIILITVQLKDPLNLHNAKKTVLLHEAIENIIRGLIDANWNTLWNFLIFLGFFAYLNIAKRLTFLPSWLPHQLFALVAGILITWGAKLNEHIDTAIVKDVPTDFPPVGFPSMSRIGDTAVTSVVITLIAFLQMYSIATRMSSDVHANKELYASGMCATIAGLLGGIPGSSSFARCSVLGDLKVKTPLNCLIAAVVVFGCAAGLTRVGVFYYLPKLVLSAIIISSVSKLVDFSHAIWLFRLFRVDFAVWTVSFLLTLFLGVAVGILSGIGLSIIIVLFRVGIPKSFPLAFDPLALRWVDARSDDELLIHREVHVWCFDSPLYFVNVSYVTPQLQDTMDREARPIEVVVIDCSRINDIDASAVESFTVQLRNVEKRRNVTILIAGMNAKVAAALMQCPTDPWEGDRFASVEEAVKRADAIIVERKHLLAPHRPVPAALYRHTLATGLSSHDVVGVTAIVSHADRSPKQKLKLRVPTGTKLAKVLAGPLSTCGGKVMDIVLAADDEFTAKLIKALEQWPKADIVQRRIACTIATLFASQVNDNGPSADFAADSFHAFVKRPKGADTEGDVGTLVVKWGGCVTAIGAKQAEACGQSLAMRLGLAPDDTAATSSSQLHGNTHDAPRGVHIEVASNEEQRVLETGLAFSEAFCGALGQERPETLRIEPGLNADTAAMGGLEDACMAEVSRALHANTQRAALLARHVPGMRSLEESLAHRGLDGATPHAVLVTIAKMVADLVEAVDGAAHDAEPVPQLRLEETIGTLSDAAHLFNNGSPTPNGAAASANFRRDMTTTSPGTTGADALAPANGGPLAGIESSHTFEMTSRTDTGVVQPSASSLTFAHAEPASDFVRRYSILLAQFMQVERISPLQSDAEGGERTDMAAMSIHQIGQTMELSLVAATLTKRHRFDVTKLRNLYDNATYDLVHNASRLSARCNFDMRELVAILQPLYVAVTCGRFGTTPSARRVSGALFSSKLMRRLFNGILGHIEQHRVTLSAATEAEQAEPRDRPERPAGGSAGSVATHTGDGSLPVALNFTAPAMITALRYCLAFSEVMRAAENPHAREALSRDEVGWHYMQHIVFTVTHCPQNSNNCTSAAATPEDEAAAAATEKAPAEADEAAALRGVLNDYTVDVFLSTGASLRTEAAQQLLRDGAAAEALLLNADAPADGDEPVPTPGEDPAKKDDNEGHAEVAVDEPTVIARGQTADERTRQAARHLTKVAPMLRVWRVSAAQLQELVRELEAVVARWTDAADNDDDGADACDLVTTLSR